MAQKEKRVTLNSNGGRRSTFAGNSTQLPSDVIDFALLPAHWLLLDVMWPRINQWERALLGKNFQLYNIWVVFQCPEAIIALFNSVLDHLADVVSSRSLQDLSWPISELALSEEKDEGLICMISVSLKSF